MCTQKRANMRWGKFARVLSFILCAHACDDVMVKSLCNFSFKYGMRLYTIIYFKFKRNYRTQTEFHIFIYYYEDDDATQSLVHFKNI